MYIEKTTTKGSVLMKIGYACIPLTVNYKTNRSFNLKNFCYDKFVETTAENIHDLKRILQNNIDNNIFMFRISSDIIPFGSHEINNIKWWEIFRNELADIGKFILQNDIRVSMHPGQYTVLNSPTENTVANAVRDLEYHTLFLDSLGVDYSHKIVLHGGGIYGDKVAAMERFKTNFKKLSKSAQSRLILENDERSYNIQDILGLCYDLEVPAVFDNLHHKFNNCGEEDLKEIVTEVFNTWREKDGSVKLHYSDEDLDKRKGAHSKFVITKNFLSYVEELLAVKPESADFDIMLEVKDKDISAIKCINSVSNNPKKSMIFDEWARYKYAVMSQNYMLYKHCSKIVKNGCSLRDLYFSIEDALMQPADIKNFKNTAEHVWGYFKDKATEKEKKHFITLLTTEDTVKIKENLYRLAVKYEVQYLLKSYFFI